MTYIENIFLCMVSPLLVGALCMGRRQLRFFLFCIAGMGVCLLSAYINTFLAAVCQADALAATADGPSLGTAPSGKWTWMSFVL